MSKSRIINTIKHFEFKNLIAWCEVPEKVRNCEHFWEKMVKQWGTLCLKCHLFYIYGRMGRYTTTLNAGYYSTDWSDFE